MGLFTLLRDLFSGSSAETSEAAAQPPAERSPGRLPPLRYRTTLRRTPTEQETDGTRYPYAHRNPRTGWWLDLSTDSDPRWLDYYGLPHLKTPQDLAEWLQMPLGRLVWLTHRLADGMRPQAVEQSHYHYRWVRKRSGGVRLIEAPKPLLKAAQETVLHGILERVPPHPNAHGFVSGRSFLSNARPHVGRRIILKFDLENFYASVSYRRIVAIYRSLGFSRDVAIWLTRLTSSSVPPNLSTGGYDHDVLRPYRPRHLPQGAPTSPALANLSAHGLDVRLTGLARSFDVNYTRYADDLTFSGSHRFGGALRDFIPLVRRIVEDERFRTKREKRRILRSSQRQTVTGVVVNARPNISRSEFDRLKAILHNCIRHGPAGQNRDAHPRFAEHLRGRIAHVMQLHPQRGRRLLEMFQRIDWSR